MDVINGRALANHGAGPHQTEQSPIRFHICWKNTYVRRCFRVRVWTSRVSSELDWM